LHTPFNRALPFFAEHLKKEGKSEHTIKAFMADLNLLAGHTGEDRALGKFQTRHLDDFLHWMENERGVPCSRKTYARRVTSLKVFFKWLLALDVIAHDPAKAVVQRSGEAPLSYALTPDEIRSVFEFAPTMERKGERDTRPELLFWLLLDTGIKKSEAMRLTMDDIHTDNPALPYLHVHHTVRNVYKERKIPIDPKWVDLFDEYRAQYKLKDKIFTCTARNLEYILSDLSDGAGVSTKISFEIMRWTGAVRDFREGMDPELIRERMGLSKISWNETGRKIERLVEKQIEAEQASAS
ncbi:MAG: site-specific integrase, partial [Chloroflexota bacterium]